MGDNNPNTNDRYSGWHYNINTFIAVAFICCGIYVFCLHLHDGHIKDGQDRIIRIYDQQLKKYESSHISGAKRAELREKELEKFHQEIKSLLELEYNRIQNEFESIEIWAAVLTIIFLIFSFYSLFKTEQLENQSKEELLKIKKIGKDGQAKLDKFDTDSEKGLKSLDTALEEVKKDTKEELDGILSNGRQESLTIFDKSAKKILEAYKINIVDLLAKHQSSIEKSYELYVKKLQSVAEKDMDLTEDGEDELDDEELRKDKENEEMEG